MRNILIGVIVLIVLLVVGYFVFWSGRTDNQNTETPSSNSPNQDRVTEAIPVTIQNFAFTPGSITIKAGTKVVWTNRDSATHTVNSPQFNSQALSQGQSYEYTFTKAGTYPYDCDLHPNMKGTVTVQ